MTEKEKQLYRIKAEVLKSLAHPLRLAIIDYLKEEEKCVCEIVEHLKGEQSNISRHLGVLKRSGVLSSRKEGLRVYYCLNLPCVPEFFSCVTELVDQRLKEAALLLG